MAGIAAITSVLMYVAHELAWGSGPSCSLSATAAVSTAGIPERVASGS
jgi:hypothetical protein